MAMLMMQRTYNDLQQYNRNQNENFRFFTENAQPSSVFGPAWKGLTKANDGDLK